MIPKDGEDEMTKKFPLPGRLEIKKAFILHPTVYFPVIILRFIFMYDIIIRQKTAQNVSEERG